MPSDYLMELRLGSFIEIVGLRLSHLSAAKGKGSSLSAVRYELAKSRTFPWNMTILGCSALKRLFWGSGSTTFLSRCQSLPYSRFVPGLACRSMSLCEECLTTHSMVWSGAEWGL